jgi:hypothetical protein
MERWRDERPDRPLQSLIYLGGAIAAVSLSWAIARLIAPFVPVLALMGGGGLVWHLYQRHQRQRQVACDQAFYELLRQHQGRMMVLDFAIATQQSAIAAQQFLDAKALEFSARYEVTQTGEVFYIFPTLQLPPREFQGELGELQDLSSGGFLGALPVSLTQTQLAQRLGVSPDTIRRHKTTSDWPTWSQAKDPIRMSWRYLPETQRFVPTSGAISGAISGAMED